ncbi:hypothetical protein TSOC_002509 [Tetrabaena socialis]|uniref:Uncharacterized protein n=1 Tax=Tetrabaena socialis TaxID=47790 RepID=A0A2J8ADX9_9CHLO|nr:hypothetical protein TSOC_002509 [Tetrabaena socialis]|eukprot:PNH10712.1 hypothetical protein TSOC_002509 [Tetrabaena socialis]
MSPPADSHRCQPAPLNTRCPRFCHCGPPHTKITAKHGPAQPLRGWFSRPATPKRPAPCGAAALGPRLGMSGMPMARSCGGAPPDGGGLPRAAWRVGVVLDPSCRGEGVVMALLCGCLCSGRKCRAKMRPANVRQW